MVKLSIQDSEGRTTIVPLADGELEIGRDDSNAICLTDRNVSRHHAKLTVSGSRVWIENVQASWGTKLNKLLIREKHEIAEGDLLQVGDYTLEINSEGQKQRDTALRDDAPARTASKGVDGATAMINLADLQGLAPAAGPSTAIPEASQPRLVVESENLRGLELRISKTPIVLGRVRENADLVLDHRSISKEHARLTRMSNGTWQILDLGSANGLKVNGEPYSKCDVESGDRIELGHVTLRFLASGIATPGIENVGGPKRSKLPLAIAVGVAAALLAVGAVVALSGGKKPVDAAKDDAATAPAAIAKPEAPTAEPAAAAEPTPGTDQAAPDAATAEAPKAPETAGSAATDALAKAEILRKTGAYDDALQVLRAADTKNAQISLRLRQLEAEKKWKAQLDLAESLLAKDPASALEHATEAKAHFAVDDPLAATAEKIIDAAKAGLSEKHKGAKPEAKAKPEPTAVAKPEPKPEAKPKPEPKPEPPPEVKAAPATKSGKDLYEEGRSAQMDGKTDAAIGLYQQAAKAGFGKAHKQLALLYQARNDKAGCAKNAKAYLEKNPSAGDADAMQQLLDKCSN